MPYLAGESARLIMAVARRGLVMLRKMVVLVAVLVGASVVAAGALEYFTAPRRIASAWLACGGTEDSSLVTTSDRHYWSEAQPDTTPAPFNAYLDACVIDDTIESVSIRGRSAVVEYVQRAPQLDYTQMTEFPATSTPAERIRLIRKRASKARIVARHDTLRLRLDGLRWRVSLGLKGVVLFTRATDRATALERAGHDDEALAIYDSLEMAPDADSARIAIVKELRVNALAVNACRSAATQRLKYPESAAFNLQGLGTAGQKGPTLVVGSVLAPNGFGVKRKINVSCDVTFSKDKPEAEVSLTMFSTDDPSSMISGEMFTIHL